MGQCRIPVVLHGQLWSHVGSCVSISKLHTLETGQHANCDCRPWAMPSEVFPSSLRGKGVALSTSTNWLMNFIIVSTSLPSLGGVGETGCITLTLLQGLITPPLVQNTNWGAYTFFAVFCLLSFIWTYFFIPETSGRTLEQMDMVFKDVSGEEEKARRAAIESDIMSGHPEVTVRT